MRKHSDKKQELHDQLVAISKAAKLDSWTSFVEDLQVPQEMLPALMTGRGELLCLLEGRDMSKDEVKKLLTLIATLMETNFALREHASQLAKFTVIWADSFKQLESLGQRIRMFAGFDHSGASEEEEDE